MLPSPEFGIQCSLSLKVAASQREREGPVYSVVQSISREQTDGFMSFVKAFV